MSVAGPLNVPFEHAMMFAGILLILGLAGVIVRRDTIFILLSLEVMLNAAGLAFVLAAARFASPDGQVMFYLRPCGRGCGGFHRACARALALSL